MSEVETGVISKNSGGFGFIKPDHGDGPEMFVMPAGCIGFGNNIPSIGTPVSYAVVVDSKTGRPRADNVFPPSGAMGGDSDFSRQSPQFTPTPAPAWEPVPPHQQQLLNSSGSSPDEVADRILSQGRMTGTVLKNNGKFGFIQQDNGEPDMFVMPIACKTWGEVVPVEGTRVVYDVVMDLKTGRPRAENVLPEEGAPVQQRYPGYDIHPGYGAVQQAPLYARSQPYSPPAFHHPIDLRQVPLQGRPPPSHLWGMGMQPPMHMPMQEAYASQPPVPAGVHTGSMASINGKYGFIKQDSGEPDMFVMPAACRAFGDALPAPGTRLQFNVVIDHKTGRPRAEEVAPLS